MRNIINYAPKELNITNNPNFGTIKKIIGDF
jgi:hypothetical protein